MIRGAEPVVVDTGCSLAREQWLANLRAVVDLDDVRWIFLSHDDHDHIGNLDVVLARPVLPTPGQAMLDELLATFGQPAPSAA